MEALERLKFPIGPFDVKAGVSDDQLPLFIEEIASAPAQLRAAVEGLTEAQLDSPYRPEGWTVRQVSHHLVDSHMNSIIRMKWALTEDAPTIKTYYEERWAELADSKTAPIEIALKNLGAIHERWVYLLNSMTGEPMKRCFVHPEMGRISNRVAVAFYAWHGRHHVAHVTSLRQREGW